MNVESIFKSRLISVAVIDRLEDALPLAEALLAGGLNVLEITFRTAAAAESIARIRRNIPQMITGAGTLLTSDQVKQAVDAGSQFGVSPGLSEVVSKAAHANKMPLLPGCVTPTEVMHAMELGWTHLKFFPAETFPNKAQPVPPIYQPEVAANAIVFAATNKRREIYCRRRFTNGRSCCGK